MANPTEKVIAGQSIRQALTAPAFNRFVDAAQIARRLDNQTRAPALRQFRQAGIIKVRNDSGEKRGRFDILGIDVPLITVDDSLENWQNQVHFKGVKPAIADHQGKFVVLLDALQKEGVGRAFISGVCSCQIDVTDTTHNFADVKDAEAGNLVSADYGSAQILWREGGTGKQWADVRLGNDVGLAERIEFTLDAALDPTDTSVSVSVTAFFRGADPGATVTVKTPGAWEADNSAIGWAWYDGTDYKMGNVDCPGS